jgi:hypothetical protein
VLTSTSFAQAWRKRTTVPFTRAVADICQSFSERPSCPSDKLIAPLVKISEFMCRISDYFSYDDVENSELQGEHMLELATSNFRAELQNLRDAMPEDARQNSMWPRNTIFRLMLTF